HAGSGPGGDQNVVKIVLDGSLPADVDNSYLAAAVGARIQCRKIVEKCQPLLHPLALIQGLKSFIRAELREQRVCRQVGQSLLERRFADRQRFSQRWQLRLETEAAQVFLDRNRSILAEQCFE